jgi:hypothetical protein
LIDRTKNPLGKVLALTDTADGLRVTVEVGGRRARDMLADLERAEDYYLERCSPAVSSSASPTPAVALKGSRAVITRSVAE